MRAGRSPLTRGRPVALRRLPVRSGSIPAHAGQTEARRRPSPQPEVDPRSRGADAEEWAVHDYDDGRSPLTRGRHSGQVRAGQQLGSIPAHAGQTTAAATPSAPAMVDPRSRGADSVRSGLENTTVGRSPLTRGRLSSPQHPPQRLRSIPAHAGQTSSMVKPLHVWEVDPRSRGADRTRPRATSCLPGRSPLTRGRRRGCPLCRLVHGSIPAHAGQTAR